MIEKEIEHLKSMKVNVPPERATVTHKHRTHIKALTYAPKIPAVQTGEVRQTIRPIVFAFRDKKHRLGATPKPIMPGDIILFHGWRGKPYRSPWSWRLKVRVDEMLYLKIYKEGISRPQERHWQLNCPTHRLGFMPWSECDELAKQDGIKDGETMGRVFNGMYRLEIYNDNGMDMGATKYFQIIRWSWPPLESNSLVGESQ